jgi:hypothetical protein
VAHRRRHHRHLRDLFHVSFVFVIPGSRHPRAAE